MHQITAPNSETKDGTNNQINNEASSSIPALLLKPGWVIGEVIAIKAVTFFPDNGQHHLPTVNAGVLLFDANNGLFLGGCDGNELTTRRTAAASAVAAKRLVRPNAEHLLVIGTGALAPRVAEAHCFVRDYSSVRVWGRDRTKAANVVEELTVTLPSQRRGAAPDITVAEELDPAVQEADTICCVTGSTHPLVKGALLRTGAHVDLIGSFSAQMRETDDDTVRRASIWVDSPAEALAAGDLAQPIESGVLEPNQIKGTLADLIKGPATARQDADEITLFKSAGMALEDVAAAQLVFTQGG